MNAAKLSKVFEPSRIRRGRMATSPTWFVDAPNGSRWRFPRKQDAQRFIAGGCVCPNHQDYGCPHCIGSLVREPVFAAPLP